MWSALLLGGALAVGQPPELPPPRPSPSPDAPPNLTVTVPPQPNPEAPPPTKTAPAPPDRWPLMRALQGTWYGAQLDDNRLGVSGWTDGSFTAGTDRRDQLPMGFNYRADEFLL